MIGATYGYGLARARGAPVYGSAPRSIRRPAPPQVRRVNGRYYARDSRGITYVYGARGWQPVSATLSPPITQPAPSSPVTSRLGAAILQQPVGGGFVKDVQSIATNPMVDSGLNALGTAFGDPTLGQQVATIAMVAPQIVSAVGAVASGIGSLFSGPDLTASLGYAGGASVRGRTNTASEEV